MSKESYLKQLYCFICLKGTTHLRTETKVGNKIVTTDKCLTCGLADDVHPLKVGQD
jgi:hypothetical protein